MHSITDSSDLRLRVVGTVGVASCAFDGGKLLCGSLLLFLGEDEARRG